MYKAIKSTLIENVVRTEGDVFSIKDPAVAEVFLADGNIEEFDGEAEDGTAPASDPAAPASVVDPPKAPAPVAPQTPTEAQIQNDPQVTDDSGASSSESSQE